MRWLLPILLFLGAAFGQGIRLSDSLATTASVGGATVLAPVGNATIQICSFPANGIPCTNKVTTYTDSTLVTPCSTSTQVTLAGTTSCIASADVRGNWGAWVPAGNYDWTFVTSTGAAYGPFTFTASGANISAGAGPLGQIIDTGSPNSGTTGTTALMLAKESTADGTIVNCANGDAGSNIKLFPIAPNISGSCGAGTTGNACRVIAGKANITIDSGGVTVGHFVGCSGTQAPKGTDLGASVPPGQGCAGQALATAVGGTVVTIDTQSCAVPASTGYSTVANNGVNLTQRSKLECDGTVVVCSDDAGNSATKIALGAIQAPDGSAAAPSISLLNSPGYGFYRHATAVLGFAANGSALGIIGPGGIRLVPGSPGYGFCTTSGCTGTDTLMARNGAGIFGFGDGTNPSDAQLQAGGYTSGGTTFTGNNGCTESALSGGATAGRFTVGQNTACTIIITMGNTITAPNGWSCWASDQTAVPSVAIRQTASSQTTASLLMTVATNDVIAFGCVGY